MAPTEMQKLLARLAELHQKSDLGDSWHIRCQPHNYRDGTTHFTHVQCTAHDVNGDPMTVSIAQYLTPALAELLVLSHNHLPEIIKWARKGLEV